MIHISTLSPFSYFQIYFLTKIFCFAPLSQEHVLNANGQRPPNPARLNNHPTTLDTTGVRQMILTEAIPRLVSRVQGNDDVNVMSHPGSGC